MDQIIDQIDNLLEQGLPKGEIETGKGITLYLLAHKGPFIGKFILDMVSHLPIKNSDPSFFSLERVRDSLILAKVHFEDNSRELKSYLERILYELEWGARSPYHAARILEMKALSMDEKRGLIQDRVLSVIRRFPRFFDYDLFKEMQQFFLTLSDQYFRSRSVREVAQTVIALYSLRKKISELNERFPERRHVAIKVLRRHLNFPLEQREGLEVVIGMNVLKENEVFKKNHLLKAVQNILPNAKCIAGSEYHEKEGEDPLHLLTLEIEKEGGFEMEEIVDLKRWLPRTLKGKVEQLQRSLFMPRNEEEILRNVITLGRELRFARDFPQIIISFEKQTESHLIFTVILARILLPDAPPLEEILLASPLRPKIDRIKQLGMLRKKYPKEAAVFKVKIPIRECLREDHSIDLYQARQTILNKLQAIFGEIRDYNGGMISKQNEIFERLKNSLGAVAEEQKFLLENFFHSLFPLEKRSFIDPEVLKIFFQLILEKFQEQKPYLSREKNNLFFVIGENRGLEKINEISSPMITLDLEYEEKQYFGFIAKKTAFNTTAT